MPSTAVKNVPLGTPLAVRARIMTLGWPSLAAWAHAHGHKPGIVNVALRTWGQRSDRAPHGGLSCKVVQDLRVTMDHGITPEDVTPSVEGVPA